MAGVSLLYLLLSSSSFCLLVGLVLGKPPGSPPLPPSLYQNFLENTRANFSSCTSFPLGELAGNGLGEFCDVAPPSGPSVTDNRWLEKEENRPSLLCYSLFMSVWTVCLQDATKVNVSAIPLEEANFCTVASKLVVPKNCNVEHCQALRAVESVIFHKQATCQKECVDEKSHVLRPVCQQLYYAMEALFKIRGEAKMSAASSNQSTAAAAGSSGASQQGKAAAAAAAAATSAAQASEKGTAADDGAAAPAGAADKGQASASAAEKGVADKSAAAGTGKGDKKETAEAGGPQREQLEAGEELEDDLVMTTEEEERLAPPPPRKEQEEEDKSWDKKGGIEDTMSLGPKEEGDTSGFFPYFMLLSVVCIIAYLVFHNKQKILALILEGRRRQGSRRRSHGREYRKLDSNLEESMDLSREASVRQVIY